MNGIIKARRKITQRVPSVFQKSAFHEHGSGILRRRGKGRRNKRAARKMKQTRKFNGNEYRLEGHAPTKKEATRRVKRLKEQGIKYVRIVKMKGTSIIGATSSRYGKTNYFIYSRRTE